jgi:hypothetical protein
MEYKWQSLLRMSFLNFLILKDQTEVKVLIDVIQGGKALEVVLSGNKITPMLFPKAKNINSVKQIIDLKFGDKTGFSAIRLKGADGKDYKIFNLNKSKEFGGGGGNRG